MKLFRVIDFETTGLPTDEGGASICEAAFCDVRINEDGSTLIDDPRSMLCNPGRPIPATARALHHIGDAEVAGKPTVAETLERITCAEDGVIYVAHRADFEASFFAPKEPWICTYKVAVRLWPDAPSHSNQVLRYFLNLELDQAKALPAHRAGPDAYVTAHLLARCISENRASIEEMVRWSAGPALLPRITFGKHKGSKWEEVPRDYLEWVANKSDLDADVKANARHHLKRRAA